MSAFAGRSKNVWESPIGCLMFSFTIQMDNGRIVPLLQYVVSLAITEAIKDISNQNVSKSIQLLTFLLSVVNQMQLRASVMYSRQSKITSYAKSLNT